jgi:small GTP-binding protein
MRNMDEEEVKIIIQKAIQDKATELDLSGNGLESLPPEIGELKSLTKLYLSENGLENLPPEIGALKNLTTLYLWNNSLEGLPSEIRELKSLTVLDLSGNVLESLPPEIGELESLTVLDLSGNPLTDIPQWIIQLKNLNFLKLDENLVPQEISARGINSIFEFIKSTSDQYVNEAKLILLGQGDVGKTCLAKKLIYDTFQDEKSTEGIDILSWNVKAPTEEGEDIRLNVWDFGGQEIYHATHQFFLTRRSVYILVWNARKSQDYGNIYYWLHTIKAFGEDSPILLVLTKSKERDDDLNMKDIKESFPNVIGLYKVDSQTDVRDGTNVHEVLEPKIIETAWGLPQMRTRLPKEWLYVRKKLEDINKKWIPFGEFNNICKEVGLDGKATKILDNYLHDLGVIIHFRDTPDLNNMVILEPEWATTAVYKIFDSRSIRNNGGVLVHSKLEEIWDTVDYPPEIHPQLLRLMERFELAYELPDRRNHLVAELLPRDEMEYEWDDTENIRFIYRYDFLPIRAITRFIVLMHKDLDKDVKGNDACWRDGCLLSWGETRASVRAKTIDKTIEINVCGKRKKELLTKIRHKFDQIIKSKNKMNVAKEVQCICSDSCEHTFNYDMLLKGEEKGIQTFTCMSSLEEVSVTEILDGIVRREDRRSEIEAMKSLKPTVGHDIQFRVNDEGFIKPIVFISYVHENSNRVTQLRRHLEQKGIIVWQDIDGILPGDRWKENISSAIQNGDFFIACFSEEYHKRDKTHMNDELNDAVEQLRLRPTNKAWFIPVLLDNCQVPNRNIGGGATLKDIQYVSLHEDWDDGIERIVQVILGEDNS